jgi:hypothetical protein
VVTGKKLFKIIFLGYMMFVKIYFDLMSQRNEISNFEVGRTVAITSNSILGFKLYNLQIASGILIRICPSLPREISFIKFHEFCYF